jgi:hypothetical protein
MGAVAYPTGIQEDPSPYAPYPLFVGSPMPPIASPALTGPSPSKNARTKREDMQRGDVVAIPLRLPAQSKGEDMQREDVVAIPLRLPARSINRLSRS